MKSQIDCDIHPALPDIKVLIPYFDDYWREQVVSRGIDGLDLASYPPRNPIVGRADWVAPGAKPGTSLDGLKRHALDGFGSRFAICNVLYGGQTVFNAYFGSALCRAINDWLAAEWLAHDKRLLGSIVVPPQDPQLAVEEIERWAHDKRFVQVLMLSGTDMALGKRYYWPIYEAAARHGLPVGVHAGIGYRFAPTYAGWPSFYIEDHAALAQTMQGQLLSLIYEGVFTKFPDLKVVLIESGVAWLPSFMWRADNTWRGLRMELPWVKESPAEIIRRQVRFTTQPFDAPDSGEVVNRLINQMGSDDLLMFSSDYPHWQFDGDNAYPAGLSDEQMHRLAWENPLATYPRISELVQ